MVKEVIKDNSQLDPSAEEQYNNILLKDKFASITNHAPFCVHEITTDGYLINVSNGGLRMLNAKSNDVENKYYFDFIDEEHRARIFELFQRSIRGEMTEFEFRINNSERDQYFLSNFIPMKKMPNGLYHLIGTSQDITILKTTELKLQETISQLTKTNLELEKYNYSISHDLREPVRSISSSVQMLNDKIKFDSVNSTIFQQIDNNIKFMNDLICSLSEYSQITQHSDNYEQVNLRNLIEEVISNFKNNIQKTIEVVDDVVPNKVKINKLHIRQIFQNLISNAIKYNENKIVKLSIKMVIKQKSYSFAIADNGIGIDKQHHDKIFDAACNISANGKVSGSGLGLAICKKIVEIHKGDIWLESSKNGSSFFFTLPIK
jgi:PAS domain S-box-containing protein